MKVHAGQDVAQLAREIGTHHQLGTSLTEAIAEQIRYDPGACAEKAGAVTQSSDVLTLTRFDGSDSAALLDGLQAALDKLRGEEGEAGGGGGQRCSASSSSPPSSSSEQAVATLALQHLHELRRLSRDGVRRLEALEDGALVLVVRAMDAFPACAPLQSAAMAVLHNLCHVTDRHDAYCDHLAFAQGAARQVGGVGAVLRTMGAHGSDIELLTLSLRTLCNLCHGDALNQSEVAAHGGGSLLPKLLFAHADDEKLAAEALRALFAALNGASASVGSAGAGSTSSCNNSCSCRLGQGVAEALGAGALSAAVLAMETHAEHAGVQISGLLALHALLAGGGAAARREAHRSGVLRIIAAALDVHLESELVLRQALRLLSLFCAGDEGRTTAAVHIGAINAVLNAMEHKANGRVAPLQAAGLEALFNLCNHDEANQAALAVSGGVASVVSAMLRHPGMGDPGVEAQVQEAGMRLLFLLSCNVSVHHMLQNSDARRATLAVQANFPLDFQDSFGPAVLQNLDAVKRGRTNW